MSQSSQQQTLLHIGFHKTATNFYQKKLYPKVANYRYIEQSQVNSLFFSNAFEFDEGKVSSFFENHDLPLIICHEELSGNIHTGGLNGFLSSAVAQRLRIVFSKAKVVIFVRNQLDMIEASYKQYVKGGGTYSIDKYLSPSSTLETYYPLFHWQHFNYLPIVELYRELFGVENVFVFPYEEMRDDPKSFLQRYVATLGLAVDLGGIALDDKVNPSPNGFETRLLRFGNLFSSQGTFKYYLMNVPKFRNAVYSFVKHLSYHRSKRFAPQPASASFLSESLREEIIDYYGRANSSLQQLLDEELEAHGYPLAR